MGSTEEGSIQKLAQARGMNKALDRMVQSMMEVTQNCENRILYPLIVTVRDVRYN